MKTKINYDYTTDFENFVGWRPTVSNTSIILLTEDDERMSWLGLREYQMRFGSARLKMGGICGVGTKEKYRNKGYSRRVMEATIAYMSENRFDVSMLFGIPNFYYKFGYATVIPETYVEFETKDVPADAPAYQVRKLQTEDAPKVVELYSANNAERTETPLRTEIGWKEFTNRAGIVPDPYVVLSEADEVIGYFVCNSDNTKIDMIDRNCTLFDIGFQDRTIFQTIVHFLAHSVNYPSAERIKCAIPADHPFAIFCRRYGCRTNTYTPKDHMGMVRIIDQSGTLKKITGELEKRLQRSTDFSEWRGKILFSTDLGQDCLEIDQGSVVHTNNQTNAFHFEVSQDKLSQLMMGRRNIEDLAIESDVWVNEGIIPVLDTLFPLGHPHVWWSDRF